MKAPLPPSIEGAIRERVRTRTGRVRIELTPTMAQWMHTMIGRHMQSLDVTDPEFRQVYLVYRSIADQLDKLGETRGQ